jgi:hypothetical protein
MLSAKITSVRIAGKEYRKVSKVVPAERTTATRRKNDESVCGQMPLRVREKVTLTLGSDANTPISARMSNPTTV